MIDRLSVESVKLSVRKKRMRFGWVFVITWIFGWVQINNKYNGDSLEEESSENSNIISDIGITNIADESEYWESQEVNGTVDSEFNQEFMDSFTSFIHALFDTNDVVGKHSKSDEKSKDSTPSIIDMVFIMVIDTSLSDSNDH